MSDFRFAAWVGEELKSKVLSCYMLQKHHLFLSEFVRFADLPQMCRSADLRTLSFLLFADL
jgi:hypothetical protein